MMKRVVRAILAFSWLSCSGDETSMVGVGGAMEAPLEPIWRESSATLMLTLGGEFEVGAAFVVDRSALPVARLAELSSIRARHSLADGIIFPDTVSVFDSDGSVEIWRYDEIEEGLDRLGGARCYSDSNGASFSINDPAGTPTRDWEHAPVLSSADAGCLHGVRHYGCQALHFRLEVSEPGVLEFSTHGSDLTAEVDPRTLACTEPTRLELFADGANMPVLASAAPTDGCPLIRHEFTEPGTYWLRVSRLEANCAAPDGSDMRQLLQVARASGCRAGDTSDGGQASCAAQ